MNIRPATRALLAAAAVAAAGCSSASEEDVAATPAPAVEVAVDTTTAVDTVAYEARRDTAAPPIQARVEADPQVTTDTSADAAISAGAGMASHTFNLTGLNNSTATGQVTVRPVGEQEVEVAINLSGVEANAQRNAAIYRGTCANPGTTVEALQDVGTGMEAQSTTTLQIPLTQLLAGDHVVIVREDAMGQSNPIACAELMQRQ